MKQITHRSWRPVPEGGKRTLLLALVAALAVSLLIGLAGARSVEAYIRGVDVSNWQGSISWSRVAASGERFAFAKATEGNSYNDPWYSTNRSGARANGLKFGAYHFARPSGSSLTGIRNDAYAEADRFVTKAGLGSGFLLPVLDLESTGGLSTSNLKYWVQRYLARIEYRLGVKGIIYTYPYFWTKYMGNTTWFAANGYKVLWIANWRVSSPSVPANNWNGQGWTFWQWTDCGSVPGISGCVDRDYYRYSTFTRVLIP
jgi:GH25 family lysozyme M1 (1,4-beta-N-acetylmuramidase)